MAPDSRAWKDASSERDATCRCSSTGRSRFAAPGAGMEGAACSVPLAAAPPEEEKEESCDSKCSTCGWNESRGPAAAASAPAKMVSAESRRNIQQ